MPLSYNNNNNNSNTVDDILYDDESIVLSDLIRTGETSRLRRRGAMRLEHTGGGGGGSGGSSSTRHPRRRPSVYRTSDDSANVGSPAHSTWTIVENRSSRSRRVPTHLPVFEVSEGLYDLEDSDSDSGDEMVFSASFTRAISEQTGRQYQTDSGSPSASRRSVEFQAEQQTSPERQTTMTTTTPYTLVCGGPVDDLAISFQSDPHQSVYSALASFILPQPRPLLDSSGLPPRPTSSLSVNNISTGCGAVIHTQVSPRYYHRQPMWAANTTATDAVVPLDVMYFDQVCAKEKLSMKMMRSEACGCLRVGVGCANCGNPLGFRLTPCKVLKDYLLLRQSRSHHHPRPLIPSKANGDEHSLYLYTFFCSATTSPQAAQFPAIDSVTHTHRDWSRSRTPPTAPPLLPPPPPLIRLLSDSEQSDSDEEVVIDFSHPRRLTRAPRILGGDITSSPEPQVIHLEPNPTPGPSFGGQAYSPGLPLRADTLNQRLEAPRVEVEEVEEEDSELGQARASWANVVRGVEAAAASSMGEMDDRLTRMRRPRGPERRDALGPSAEEELGIANSSQDQGEVLNSNPNRVDVPSSVLLEEEATVTLTPPPPQPHELPPSTLETTMDDTTTPRQTIWGMSFVDDGLPSTSFWGRPAEGSEWTWTNELEEYDDDDDGDGDDAMLRERPRRVFDPDGDFLEGLEGEWGEEMARELGFGMMEEKSEGAGEAVGGVGGRWWP